MSQASPPTSSPAPLLVALLALAIALVALARGGSGERPEPPPGLDATELGAHLAPLDQRIEALTQAAAAQAVEAEERFNARLAELKEGLEADEVARAAALQQRVDEAMARSATSWETLAQQLEAQHAELAAQTDLDDLRAAVEESVTTVEDMQARARALRTVLDLYTRGVGLVHGRFTVGRVRGSTYQPLRASGGGPLVVEYMGTGFLVSADGVVMTNRHVAEPWWGNDDVKRFLDRGLEPRFLRLTVTFPERAPMEVDPATVLVSDEGVDLAAFRVPIRDVPIVPLSFQDPQLYRGGRVTVLGYPTGIGALLARIEPAESAKVLGGGRDTTTLIEALSKRHLVTPIVTQGALGDVRERRLIYDAQTTSGGSGGPVFGPDGSVIAVNFAVTRSFGGSNFGVPAEYALRLLERMVAATRVTADGVRAAVRALGDGN